MSKAGNLQLLLDHEAGALVRSMLRENLVNSLSGFLIRNPDHPKALALTDPKRWEVRFQEIIEGLSPEMKECTHVLFGSFVKYWEHLSAPERVVAAKEIAGHIIAARIFANMQKDDSHFFPPGTTTLQ